MGGRCPRWGRLLFLAVANLALWLGLAAAIGMLASDGLDIGVETLIREGQATVVTYWRATPLPRPTFVLEPTAVLAADYQASAEIAVAPVEEPVAPVLVAAATGSPSSPKQLPTVRETLSPAETVATEEPPRVATATPPAWPASPIVMADPGFDRLMRPSSGLDDVVAGQPVIIHYDEQSLNGEIAGLLAQASGVPYHDVHISLEPGRIVVTGAVKVLGVDVEAELLGTLVAENCAPRVEVQAVSVGGLLTPRFVKNQASAIVVRALDWYPPDSPVCIEEIAVEGGLVTLYGYRR